MTIDPGRVSLRLGSGRGRISEVRLASERPAVARRLRGRAADDAAHLVPLLFALCAKAQGCAARLALAAARGAASDSHVDAAVQGEALREHLRRWLLDLPVLFGQVALRAEFVAAAACVANGRREELGALLADRRVTALCQRLCEADDITEAPRRLLPPLDAAASLVLWPHLGADFCRMPQWQGAAAETGAIARKQYGAGMTTAALAARWLARLEELQDWAVGSEKVGAGGTASAAAASAGVGRAAVETARGLLMHEIVLDGERIADYFIVAPTEWNFHPQGPLPGWLMGRDASDRGAVQSFAARAVATLDPCVRWELEWL